MNSFTVCHCRRILWKGRWQFVPHFVITEGMTITIQKCDICNIQPDYEI